MAIDVAVCSETFRDVNGGRLAGRAATQVGCSSMTVGLYNMLIDQSIYEISKVSARHSQLMADTAKACKHEDASAMLFDGGREAATI